ncbi:hypothetical protein LMH87_000679 [Akanthomyces muscarius]|uniref:Uncharacterized protein n=1 Tax=Akanthomyces muscarius TaxID=2231603 RepID=A0A9W8UMT2_AKAMU|nr:hypothetical protein LMH87_000679 [Akanthomyces muscarius]KAJ4155437.1 hypothetical protein LMH87_000679 [Akanthomyces muscarius]
MRFTNLLTSVASLAALGAADDLPKGVAIRIFPVTGSGHWDIAAGQHCSNLGLLKRLFNAATVAPWAECRLYQHLDCYDEFRDHRLEGDRWRSSI